MWHDDKRSATCVYNKPLNDFRKKKSLLSVFLVINIFVVVVVQFRFVCRQFLSGMDDFSRIFSFCVFQLFFQQNCLNMMQRFLRIEDMKNGLFGNKLTRVGSIQKKTVERLLLVFILLFELNVDTVSVIAFNKIVSSYEFIRSNNVAGSNRVGIMSSSRIGFG